MNATRDHEEVVEDIVRGIFDALPTEGFFAFRAAAEADWKALSPRELVDQLGDARKLLESLHDTAETMGVVMHTVHRDALERVEAAHERARHAAGIE